MTPYGFPESRTPLCDKFLREHTHDFVIPEERLMQVSDRLQGEHALRLAQAVGVDRETVHRALVRAGLRLVAVRP